MRSTVSVARMVHVVTLALPCLLPLLSGCELEPYPSELVYPLRRDPIVDSRPTETPWNTFGPGQLDNNIARLSDIGGKTLDPNNLDDKSSQAIDKKLTDIFGTPAAPLVNLKIEGTALADLKLDKDSLAKGSKVYRRHCMHCHGVTGDGRGPTGPWVNPTPRDYRLGQFKFISTKEDINFDRKPRREDLRWTLERGIEGTAMPSFSLLEEAEKEDVISYVIHLSLRGEAEKRIMTPLLNKSGIDNSIADEIDTILTDPDQGLVAAWAESNKKGIEVGKYPYKDDGSAAPEESIRRGYRIFTDPKGEGSCIGCHLDFGRQVPFRYDNWGTLVRPANLTAGVYRGGRRPLDLYWRIRGGIRGSEMPQAKFGDIGSNPERWTNADPYWDVVNFLQALPYPHMLPNDIKEAIYGKRHEQTEHASR